MLKKKRKALKKGEQLPSMTLSQHTASLTYFIFRILIKSPTTMMQIS